MTAALDRLFTILDDEELAAFSRYEQSRANDLQRQAAKAQSEADAARKLLKKRKREVANGAG